MRKRRSNLEIYCRILEVVSGKGLGISHIMREAGLRQYQAESYLDYLVRKNMVARFGSDEVTIYRIREKGKVALEDLELMEKLS
jgi:predicted transcriptional regulator